MMATNFTGPAQVTKALLPLLLANAETARLQKAVKGSQREAGAPVGPAIVMVNSFAARWAAARQPQALRLMAARSELQPCARHAHACDGNDAPATLRSPLPSAAGWRRLPLPSPHAPPPPGAGREHPASCPLQDSAAQYG